VLLQHLPSSTSTKTHARGSTSRKVPISSSSRCPRCLGTATAVVQQLQAIEAVHQCAKQHPYQLLVLSSSLQHV